EHVPDAVRRGDLYTETTLARAANSVWLAADDPDGADADLDGRIWPAPPGVFHMQNYYDWRARGEIALYRGDVERRAGEADHVLDQLRRFMLSRVQTVRGEAHWLVG